MGKEFKHPKLGVIRWHMSEAREVVDDDEALHHLNKAREALTDLENEIE